MSWVRKKPSGRWEARYRDPAGRLRAKTFATKGDARRYLQRVGVDLQRGEYLDPIGGKILFGEVAEQWTAGLVHLKPKTVADYGCALRVHVLPAWKRVPVGQIDPASVQRYVAGMVRRGVSPARIRKAHGVLKQVLDTAVDLTLIRVNPAAGTKLPAMARQEMQFLTPPQIAALALAIQPPYDLLVFFAAYTGLRAGEIAALRTRHIDLDRRVVLVECSVSEVSGRLVEGSPKTDRSRRAVGLPGFLAEWLARHLEDAPADRHVFTAPDGGPLRHGNFYARQFKPAVRRALPADLHGLRFHDLRHTCAALLIAEGAHPKAIQQRLGHSSITVTLDRYGHLFPGLDDALTDRLDATYHRSRYETPRVVQKQG